MKTIEIFSFVLGFLGIVFLIHFHVSIVREIHKNQKLINDYEKSKKTD